MPHSAVDQDRRYRRMWRRQRRDVDARTCHTRHAAEFWEEVASRRPVAWPTTSPGVGRWFVARSPATFDLPEDGLTATPRVQPGGWCVVCVFDSRSGVCLAMEPHPTPTAAAWWLLGSLPHLRSPAPEPPTDPRLAAACVRMAQDRRTGFDPALAAAYRDRDTLPWLVFADWCGENAPRWEKHARRVAETLQDADTPVNRDGPKWCTPPRRTT